MSTKNVDYSEQFTCLSLFTGYGGLELGLKRIIPNLRTIVYVEIEAYAVANLVAKIEEGKMDAAPIWTNIKTFDGRPFRDRVDIIMGGYPCQGESISGKRLGDKDPRWLWPDIARIIEAVRPVWCFFENVPGHLSLGFPDVYRSLRNLGYKVEAGLFSAAECGAPHRRARLFILAHTQNPDRRAGIETKQGKKRFGRRGFGGDNPAMADTAIQRIQGYGSTWPVLADRQTDESHWPARPGQEQYKWEKPRCIMENPTSTRAGNQKGTIKREKRTSNVQQGIRAVGSICADSTNQGQAQSRLGRAVSGTSCRLDRLRLLGNGVVPTCAEKAFRNLMNIFKANQ